MKKPITRFFARFSALALLLAAFLLFEAALTGALSWVGALCLMPLPLLLAGRLLYRSTFARHKKAHSTPVPPSGRERRPAAHRRPMSAIVPEILSAPEANPMPHRHAA